MAAFPLLSVNVGLPKAIAVLRGEEILSGIDKLPVAAESVMVLSMGIVGDGQADLENHGGKEKAVYAYPASNWPWWTAEHHLTCKPGLFGENLTVSDIDENQVRIGDRFAWGDAILEVSQPRAPCFKLGIHTRRPDAPGLMTVSGRCGWYFRVVREGLAPANGMLEQVTVTEAPTVHETFTSIFSPAANLDVLHQLQDLAALSPSWQRQAGKRIEARRRASK